MIRAQRSSAVSGRLFVLNFIVDKELENISIMKTTKSIIFWIWITQLILGETSKFIMPGCNQNAAALNCYTCLFLCKLAAVGCWIWELQPVYYDVSPYIYTFQIWSGSSCNYKRGDNVSDCYLGSTSYLGWFWKWKENYANSFPIDGIKCDPRRECPKWKVRP